VNDFLGIASRAIVDGAKDRGLQLSKTAASALVHRMTLDEFDRLKVLKKKHEMLARQGKSAEKIEKQVMELLFEVGRNLFEDSTLIDPQHPNKRRGPVEATKVKNEIKSVLRELNSHHLA
jgi:hypothetical protein